MWVRRLGDAEALGETSAWRSLEAGRLAEHSLSARRRCSSAGTAAGATAIFGPHPPVPLRIQGKRTKGKADFHSSPHAVLPFSES